MADERRMTADELAVRLDGELSGDGSRVVGRVAILEKATADDVSWAGSQAFVERARSSSAGVLVLPADCDASFDVPTICVADPDMAICDVQRWLAPPPATLEAGVDATAVVHPTTNVDGASIGPRAVIGARTTVGRRTQIHAGVVVGEDCTIGDDCVLWPNVVVRERATIGDRVTIHPNSSIGGDGFGYLFRDGRHHKIPQTGVVVIEDDVEIGANTAIDRARLGETRIGAGTKIDNLCQVAHNVEIGCDSILVGQVGIGGSSTLGHHVVIGGQAGVTDHVRIGDASLVAAKSSVMTHVADGVQVRGIPAVEGSRYLKQEATVRRLPTWIERLRNLIKRVEALERSGDRSG